MQSTGVTAAAHIVGYNSSKQHVASTPQQLHSARLAMAVMLVYSCASQGAKEKRCNNHKTAETPYTTPAGP